MIILEQFLNYLNALYILGGAVITYFYGRHLYRNQQKEFIYFDFKLSPFEKEFCIDFAKYFIWGTFQQTLIIMIFHYVPIANYFKFPAAVFTFSVIGHLPNKILMINTFYLGTYIYFGYYILGFQSLIWAGLLHAFGGTILKKLGIDMRVWKFV